LSNHNTASFCIETRLAARLLVDQLPFLAAERRRMDPPFRNVTSAVMKMASAMAVPINEQMNKPKGRWTVRFIGSIVAPFTELYGLPLTIYL
jgi:hypothetical protein